MSSKLMTRCLTILLTKIKMKTLVSAIFFFFFTSDWQRLKNLLRSVVDEEEG